MLQNGSVLFIALLCTLALTACQAGGFGGVSTIASEGTGPGGVPPLDPTPSPTPSPTPAPGPTPVLMESFDGSIDSDFKTALVSHPRIEMAPGEGVGGSNAVKVLYIGYEDGSQRVLVNQAIPPAAEYTLNFDVKFCSDFQFVKGGKLHGLAPSNPVSGGNVVHVDEWSARGMFGANGSIKTYTYHQNLSGAFGDTKVSSGFAFQLNQYHAVSYHVRVNSPSTASNGFMRIYVDGVERVRHDNVQFRGMENTATEINTLMFNTFHGGQDPTWAPKNPDGSYKTVCAYYDNFAVYPLLRVRTAPGN